MPSLKDATQKPNNIGELIPPATPTAQHVPPIIPREQPGLGPASLGPAPSLWTTSFDSVRQWTRPGTSQGRFPSLPTKANPQLNSAARSVANKTVSAATVAAINANPPSGGVTSVGFAAPGVLFAVPVPGSPVTSAGTFILQLLNEPMNTVFAGPISTLGTIAMDVATNTVTAQGAGTITATGTSTQANDFALFVVGWQDGNYISSSNPDASWTSIFGFPTQKVAAGVWWKNVPAAGSVSATASVSTTGSSPLNGTILTLKTSGGTPAIRQSAQSVNVGFASPGSTNGVSYTSNVLAGSTLLMVAVGTPRNFPWVVTDSQGNQWVQVASTFTSIPNPGFPNNVRTQTIFAAVSGTAGANTVTIASTFPTSVSGSFFIMEVTNLAPPVQTPIFRALVPADIPGMSTGLMSPQFGGTGANLSGTGGANQVVQQTSVGGAFTVGQLDFNNLAGAVKISKYNNISTVSNGVPSEYATVDLTAKTAAITTTTLYAVPAAGAGQYRVNWNAKVTTVAGVSSTLGPLTIVYTDPDGVVQTITAAAQSNAGVIETSDSGNLTTTVMLGLPLLLNCKAGTNVTYAFAYASNAAASMNYNLHIKLEAL
jgi:hypothetical protein